MARQHFFALTSATGLGGATRRAALTLLAPLLTAYRLRPVALVTVAKE
jgi:hypothetical protein